jgi:dihydrofolate reductase
MTTVSLIVAVAKHQVIGLNNTLPWHLPEDLKRFRALTTGHHIIMGRKTYESLNRLLPDRTTIIVTRNTDYHVEGAVIAHSLKAAIARCQQDNEVFIIGGAELYKEGLQVADKLYITEIELEVAGDAYFPAFDKAEWHRVSYEPHIAASGLAFSYAAYERKT